MNYGELIAAFFVDFTQTGCRSFSFDYVCMALPVAGKANEALFRFLFFCIFCQVIFHFSFPLLFLSTALSEKGAMEWGICRIYRLVLLRKNLKKHSAFELIKFPFLMVKI